jgi:hypothetical protein
MINKICLLPILLLVSCTTTRVVKVPVPVKPKSLTNQSKVLKCVNFFMAKHGVGIESASEFCLRNYRRD